MSPRFCLIASVVLGCATAHAQVPAPAVATPSETPPTAATTEQPAAEAPPTAANGDPGLAQVELKLKSVSEERAHTTDLLPWLSVGLGAGSVLVGASAGAGYTLGCDHHCHTPNWVTLAVVAGATVATLGAIWVLNRDADIRELDSQRYQLEQELNRLRLSRPLHDAGTASAHSVFSWRVSL